MDGHVAEITVTMGNVTTGSVIIEVGGYNYTVPISGNVAKLNVTLPVGDYTAKVYYMGDDKYNPVNATSDAFHVVNKTKATVIITADSIVEIDNNLTFTVTTNSNATLVVKVNGVEVVKGADGKYRFNGTVAGDYTITAEVAENDYYTEASNSTVFTVIKHNSTVSIDVGSVYEAGSEFDINITNNTVVVVTVNGKEYPVVDGKVVIDTEDLPAGHYIVTATINENDKYYSNATTKEFDIIKRNSTVNVAVTATVVGEDAIINVTIPDDATGYVIVNVDGVNYTINTTGGKGSIAVSGLLNTTHTVHVTYLGDGKYLSSENETTFGIPKVDSSVTVNVDNITVGDVAVIISTVTD